MDVPGSTSLTQLDPQAALRELRLRAERRQLATQSLASDTAPEVQRLVQELQVHQIELEMQYEELLMAQVEAENSRAQYVDLYDFAPVGYCTLTADSTILQLNLRAAQQLGTVRQQLQGRRLALFVAMSCRLDFNRFLEQILSTDSRQTTSMEMLREDGTALFVRLEGSTATNALGERHCRLALIDITEQQRASQALELSERRFRTLFERNHDGMLLMRDNRIVDCNAATLQLLGLTDKKQLLGQHAAAFSPKYQPNGRLSSAWADELWEQTLRQGYCRFEWCRLRHGTEEFWEDVLLTAIPEVGGTIVHAAWRDITEEKQAAHRLRENEERLQEALTATAMGITDWNLTDDLLYWDARAQEIFGHVFDSNPVPTSMALSRLHPDDRPRLLDNIRKLRQGQLALDTEYRIVRPDGTITYVSMVGRMFTDEDHPRGRLLGLVRDITTRKESDEELNYKNQLLEHILVNLPVLLSRLTPEGRYLEMIGAGLQRLGLQDNELVGASVFEEFPALAKPVRKLLAGQPLTFIGTAEYQGKPVFFQNYGFFEAQRQQGIMFAIDVTESELMKEKIRQEQEFTKSLLDNSVDAIMACDADQRVTAWNQRAARLTGIPEADALGCPLLELLPHLTDNTVFQSLLRQTLAGTAGHQLNWTGLSPQGAFDLHLLPLHQSNGQGALILARDVTERNTLMAETTDLKLRQQQMVLSTILNTQEEERRRIAESLHNGVGQLLYATKLNLDMLPESAQKQAAHNLLGEAIRATRTISYELTPGVLENFGLKVALQELVKLIPRSLPVDLNLSGLEEPLPRQLQTAIYRMVQELLNNVMKHAQAREAFVSVAREDNYVYVSVEDDGVGFDTSTPRASHGIGLAGIRTRVALLGGSLNIHSRVGQGTTISLTLPVQEDLLPAVPEENQP
ncbi:PAS domain S-box protein [Hymenobacter sp. BT730]|uniref:PAS domain S-box protein n=1 Tax=Hymenobacter sp. BT730 TaxID=3063332 RepID=UPI0026DFC10C|nr:PAS domain S-box protein [Hymenobacter sp. BT730]